MKTLTSIILAGAIAATSIATTASGASAGQWGGPGRWQNQQGWNGNGDNWHQNGNGGGWHQRGPQPQQYNNNGGDAGALFAGAIIGLAFGMIATEALSQHDAPPAPARYSHYAVAMDPHVAWCKQTYQTYDEYSDTWVDFRKQVHPCIEQ